MWLFPLLLLIAIALHHRWRVVSRNQSPWKGGGFAMFSEAGRASLLTQVCVQDQGGALVPLAVLDAKDNPLRLTAILIPTEKHLLAWARWTLGSEWRRCGEAAHLPFIAKNGETISAWQVRLRLRQIEFDARAGIHRAHDLKNFSLDRGDAKLRVGP